MVDESLLSDDPDSYVTLTVVRSPGGKGAVSLHWAIEEQAKGALSPWNGTLRFDEVQPGSSSCNFFFFFFTDWYRLVIHMLVFNIISVLFLFMCTERKLEETRKEGI